MWKQKSKKTKILSLYKQVLVFFFCSICGQLIYKKKATVIHISSAIKSKQKLTLLSKWTMDGVGFKPLNCGSVATTAVAEVSLAAIESLSLGEFSLWWVFVFFPFPNRDSKGCGFLRIGEAPSPEPHGGIVASNATPDSMWMLGAYVADFDRLCCSWAMDKGFLDEIFSWTMEIGISQG